MYEKYNWRFYEKVTKCFDEHVVNSVPFYNEFQNSIANMSVYFSQDNTKIIDIGTSTGNLIGKIYNKNIKRNIKYIGIDTEESMINECKNRYNNIEFIVQDAVNYNFNDSSVVTCMLTLQFMKRDERKKLLKNIYSGLREDGSLFIVEKIKSEVVDIHDIYNDIYYDFKREKIKDTDILDKNISLRGIMKPITLYDNINDLRNIGFNKVDVFLKYHNFVGIIAIK